MKKKLLVTASTFPRFSGDTEPRFVLDLCIELNKYFDVTVLAPADSTAKDNEVLEGVNVIRYHYFPVHKWETLCYPGAIVPRIKEKKPRILLVPFLMVSLYWHLLKLAKKHDFVHAHWLIPQGIIQSFIDAPYVVTGHGGDVTSLNTGLMRILKKRAIRNAGCVTAVSEPLMATINEIYDNKNRQIISMGCNTKEFGASHRVENYFQQDDKKVILFVGRLAEKKGVTYLIEAMKDVDAKLVIVGGGPLEESLKNQAAKLDPGHEKIAFIGPKTHEELKEIYASADIFCAPSVTAQDGDKEGFGLVILEAMASGLPVVASKSGGIVDLIDDREDGLFTNEKDSNDIANKLNMLLNDQELYLKLKSNVAKKAKKYDYEEIGKKYRDIFNNLERKI